MSVAILIEFKDPKRDELYIPLAPEGAYSSEWVPLAKQLGLGWLPLFQTGTSVSVEDLPTVMGEFQRLRDVLSENRSRPAMVERLDFVLERLQGVDSQQVAGIFIG